MGINNQDQQIQDMLRHIYSILEFTPDGVKNTFNDLAAMQQMAVSTELVKVLTEDEVKTLNEAAQKSDHEKKIIIEQLTRAHSGDQEFVTRSEVAARKVLDDHIAYLRTRGDDAQKAEISKILAEIE